MVPSFCVRYKGHFKPRVLKAEQNAITVCLQSGLRLSFKTEAFSRSKNPINPTSWESVILVAGYADLMISATCSSCLLEAGENTPTITILCIPTVRG